ncbi:dihydroflavonol-4-reductase [Marinithermofilum abyssi]|uniref:Dihydroflavonol-4-reductase n=1 Tax=Marinithermofilum abyssi TaxID=1571185 RepID=A0A8J2VGK6_9BACL|nr:NAD-dependent epimerase/dehydratase family protein [Marinithermofilum abyssi]GGE09917.1 dihydroflavonol-4-reductase [Marinithermofilum abyssi]
MRVLVTGGTGFVGRNLIHLLHEEGHEVTLLHRKQSRLVDLPEGIQTRVGDVTDPESLQGSCDGMDWVFHVAGDVTWGRHLRERMFRINVDGARNMAEEAMRAGVQRFIHTSSAAAVGFPAKGEVADESYPFNGDRLDVGYAMAKRQGEEAVLKYAEKGLPAIVVNPSVIIGIRAYTPQFAAAVVKGKLRIAPEGGINICDVEDVARGHLLAALKGRIGERYILGGTNTTFARVFRMLAQAGGVKEEINVLKRPWALTASFLSEGIGRMTGKEPALAWDLGKLAGRDIHYRSDKAVRELGYTITPLEKTACKLADWVKRNPLKK